MASPSVGDLSPGMNCNDPDHLLPDHRPSQQLH
jgi:hypothetical protein